MAALVPAQKRPPGVVFCVMNSAIWLDVGQTIDKVELFF
jgi:hypothetical protein